MKMTANGKKAMMYANIRTHDEILNKAFNTGLEPVTLCKKLHRLEVRAHKVAMDYCNGENGVDSENIYTFTEPILKAVRKILGDNAPVFFNCDARGYALKFKPEWTQAQRDKGVCIYQDWGGNGIVAPDFRVS